MQGISGSSCCLEFFVASFRHVDAREYLSTGFTFQHKPGHRNYQFPSFLVVVVDVVVDDGSN